MNKLKTEINGGFPFLLNDLRFIEESYIESLRGLVDTIGFGTPSFILNGCDITYTQEGDNIIANCSPGFICINREILYVPGNQAPYSPESPLYFIVEETSPEAGKKEFADGSVQYTWLVRVAKISQSIAGIGSYIALSDILRYKQIIINELNNHYRRKIQWTLNVDAADRPNSQTSVNVRQGSDGVQEWSFFRISVYALQSDSNGQIVLGTLKGWEIPEGIQGMFFPVSLGANVVVTGTLGFVKEPDNPPISNQNWKVVLYTTPSTYVGGGYSLLLPSRIL